ncbi:MAG TPA: aminotransferase class I/II-fold pyridoxal phosphate-dependent enzyme, partial [Pirellulales bacterium]
HLAPLAELLELAEEFDAWLVVDEAHATGVFGERGRGALEAAGLTDTQNSLEGDNAAGRSRIIKIGTLSKALGAQGGFVVGPATLIELLVNKARSYLFSTALSPLLAAAGRRAVELVQSEPEPRRRLLESSAARRAQLAADGWNVGESESQIIPLIVGDNAQALALAARLRERGVIVPAIRPPTVPPGTARLRISLTARHDDDAWDRLIAALRAARETTGSKA